MSTAVGADLVVSLGEAVAQSQAQGAFAVPAGSLNRALTEFGRQAGVQVTYLASAAAGKTSPGFSGAGTREQALAKILEGSGLVFFFPNPTTVAISAPATGEASADGSTELDTILVQSESAWGPVDGIVATRSAAGTKTGAPLRNTPQAVNVVARDQMEAQGVETITQALRYTPGVVAQYSDTDVRHDWLTSRGFMLGRYLDGLRLPFGARGYAQPKIEPYGLERAEVLKGPSSVLYGQGLPGGMLNMVSKRPRDEEIREVELQYGSHDRFQTAFDFGGKLDDEGALLYRLVGVGRLSDTQYDHVEERKGYIAPSFTFNSDEGTSLTILGEYQKIDSPGGGGAPALTANGTLYTDGYAELPRSAFLGEPDYDRFTNEQAFVGYEFSKEFDDVWTFRQNLRYGYVDTDTQRVQGYCASNASCDPSSLIRYAWAFPESSRLFTVDNQAVARFSTGDASHTALFGLDYSLEDSRFEESALSVIATGFNVYDPVYGATSITRPATALRIDQDRSQVGLYAQDQIEWNDFVLSLGGRYDWADTDTRSRTSSSDTSVAQEDGKFTWRAGLGYNFDSGLSPYASYSTSFNPAAGTDRNGTPFDPTTGGQFEVGVKYQPEGVNGFITLSTYQLTQRNVLTPDPANTSYKVQTGEVRVRGVEVEGKAELADGLSLIASYAFTDSEITRDNPNSSGVSTEGNRMAFVPEHQAALWLDYTVQSDDAWGGLSFGGGARYMGQTYGDNANAYDVPGYTLFDAAIRYDFGKVDPEFEGLTASINVSNLFDKKYVSSCIGTTGCYWGEGRTIYGTLKYSW